MPFDKVRIRFRKVSDFRLISHHDLMRCFERVLRRASLPFRLTEGFHPMPRMIFALSLPLGMEGLQEVVELELTETIEPQEVLERLRTYAFPGLDFLSAYRIDLKTTARPRRAIYRFPLPQAILFDVANRCDELLRSTEVWVSRLRPTPKQLNVRPYINELRCEASELGTRNSELGTEDNASRVSSSVPSSEFRVPSSNVFLVLDLWLSQEGSARADELLRVLGLQPLLDEGEFLTRTELRLLDELSAEEVALLPALPDSRTRAAFERPLENASTQPEPESASVASEWGASPNGPVVE